MISGLGQQGAVSKATYIYLQPRLCLPRSAQVIPHVGMFFQSHSRVGLAVTLLLIAWTFFLLYRNLYSNHSVQNNNKFDLTQYSRSLLGAGVGNSTLGVRTIGSSQSDPKNTIGFVLSH